jgi:hypothetical protein
MSATSSSLKKTEARTARSQVEPVGGDQEAIAKGFGGRSDCAAQGVMLNVWDDAWNQNEVDSMEGRGLLPIFAQHKSLEAWPASLDQAQVREEDAPPRSQGSPRSGLLLGEVEAGVKFTNGGQPGVRKKMENSARSRRYSNRQFVKSVCEDRDFRSNDASHDCNRKSRH